MDVIRESALLAAVALLGSMVASWVVGRLSTRERTIEIDGETIDVDPHNLDRLYLDIARSVLKQDFPDEDAKSGSITPEENRFVRELLKGVKSPSVRAQILIETAERYEEEENLQGAITALLDALREAYKIDDSDLRQSVLFQLSLLRGRVFSSAGQAQQIVPISLVGRFSQPSPKAIERLHLAEIIARHKGMEVSAEEAYLDAISLGAREGLSGLAEVVGRQPGRRKEAEEIRRMNELAPV